MTTHLSWSCTEHFNPLARWSALIATDSWGGYNSRQCAHPADQGEGSEGWFCETKWVLGVCGLPTTIVFGAAGLWGVPITYSQKRQFRTQSEISHIWHCHFIISHYLQPLMNFINHKYQKEQWQCEYPTADTLNYGRYRHICSEHVFISLRQPQASPPVKQKQQEMSDSPEKSDRTARTSEDMWALMRSHLTVGHVNCMTQVQNSAGDSAYFYFSSRPFFTSLPFNDTAKDKTLSFSGAKMRPKKQNNSWTKRTQCETPMVLSARPCARRSSQWRLHGGPRNAKQHRARGREAISTGSKGKGLRCPQDTAWNEQLVGLQQQPTSHLALWASNTPLFPKEGKLLCLWKQGLRTLAPSINNPILT